MLNSKHTDGGCERGAVDRTRALRLRLHNAITQRVNKKLKGALQIVV